MGVRISFQPWNICILNLFRISIFDIRYFRPPRGSDAARNHTVERCLLRLSTSLATGCSLHMRVTNDLVGIFRGGNVDGVVKTREMNLSLGVPQALVPRRALRPRQG